MTPNTTIVLDYTKANVNNGNDTDGYGAEIEHFFAFSNGGLKVNLNGGKVVVNTADDVTRWGLGGTWYINNNWGIGAGYAKTENNGFELDAISAHVEWFITENFAVDLAYETSEPDDINLGFGSKLETDIDNVSLNALYRF